MELLTSGATQVRILIDEEDFARLNDRKVSIGSHGYAQIWEPELARMLLLHRWILGYTDKTGYGFLVDHIDRNHYDCRKSNLRVVDPTQSNLNREIAVRELPLGVYRQRSGRYYARVSRYSRAVYCGTWDSVDEAVMARDAALEEAF